MRPLSSIPNPLACLLIGLDPLFKGTIVDVPGLPEQEVKLFRLLIIWVQPHSIVDNPIIEVNDKMVGFNSRRRRKSSLNEGFTGNSGDSYSVF